MPVCVVVKALFVGRQPAMATCASNHVVKAIARDLMRIVRVKEAIGRSQKFAAKVLIVRRPKLTVRGPMPNVHAKVVIVRR